MVDFANNSYFYSSKVCIYIHFKIRIFWLKCTTIRFLKYIYHSLLENEARLQVPTYVSYRNQKIDVWSRFCWFTFLGDDEWIFVFCYYLPFLDCFNLLAIFLPIFSTCGWQNSLAVNTFSIPTFFIIQEWYYLIRNSTRWGNNKVKIMRLPLSQFQYSICHLAQWDTCDIVKTRT